MYGSIRDDCNELVNEFDKKMTAGPQFEYLWMDNKKYKKPTSVSAPSYCTMTMNYLEEMINDEKIFPIDENKPFPKNFKKVHVKSAWKKMFRILAHIMIEHFKTLEKLGIAAHVNTTTKHLLLFSFEYDLLSSQEIEPLVGWMESHGLGEYVARMK